MNIGGKSVSTLFIGGKEVETASLLIGGVSKVIFTRQSPEPPTPTTIEGTPVTINGYSFKYAFFGNNGEEIDFNTKSLLYDSTWEFPHWCILWCENPLSQGLENLYIKGHGSIDYSHRSNFRVYGGGAIDTPLTSYTQFAKGVEMSQYQQIIATPTQSTSGVYAVFRIQACDIDGYYATNGRFWSKIGTSFFTPTTALASPTE